MSTQEATKGQDPYTPSQEDIESQGRSASWRIANGKWRLGPGDDGEQQKDSVVGVPVRFGTTEEYETSEGKVIDQKFRIVLRLTDGSNFTGQMRLDSTQARYLMGALTLWDGVSFISITPNLGKVSPKYGKAPTYANVKQCEGPQKWVELRWEGGSADWKALPQTLQEELGTHPLYKNWVYEDEEAEAAEPWAGLNKVLASHGYEEFTGQPAYVEWIRKGLKNPKWDANNCTDWSVVESLVEKFHKTLPVELSDPFRDE